MLIHSHGIMLQKPKRKTKRLSLMRYHWNTQSLRKQQPHRRRSKTPNTHKNPRKTHPLITTHTPTKTPPKTAL